MKSCRDDLIARTKTGRGCFVLASHKIGDKGTGDKSSGRRMEDRRQGTDPVRQGKEDGKQVT